MLHILLLSCGFTLVLICFMLGILHLAWVFARQDNGWPDDE
jgi:hypothetical protein